MSEPDAAFVKLKIARADLVRWLDAPVPRASRWTDWRRIHGQYAAEGRNGEDNPTLEQMTDAALSQTIKDADDQLQRFADNRDAIRHVLLTAEAPPLKHAVYDDTLNEFVAGSLTYSENLGGYIVFLSIARGAADFLAADGHGLVLLHAYLWDHAADGSPGALRLGPGAASSFMASNELSSAVGAFQPIVSAIDFENLEQEKPGRDDLDHLR